MASPITIPIIRDPDYDPDDVVQIQIDSQSQNDRVQLWAKLRDDPGFGFDAMESGVFGWSSAGAPLFGAGPFGLGWFGYDIKVTDYQTTASFVAGDYTIKLRSRDAKGNASDWSDGSIIAHRPDPPPPEGLAITTGVLSWTWSDP
jgi:hypothetical protein